MNERILVVELASGRRRPIWEGEPLISSKSCGWKGFALEEDRPMEVQLDEVSGDSHIIGVNLDKPLTMEWSGDGASVCKNIAPGEIGIVPASLPFSVHYRTEGKVVRVALEQSFLLCATAELAGVEPIVLGWGHGLSDPLMLQLVLGLRAEAQNNSAGGALYAEALATTLAVHLVRKHSRQRPHIREYRGGLTKFQLRRIIDFVHEQLAAEISLNALAS